MNVQFRIPCASAIQRAFAAIMLLACADAFAVATITGGSASGTPGQQVSVTFTVNGDGQVTNIEGALTVPGELSFVGTPTGAQPPLICNNQTINYRSPTGGPIPTNAGSCTYTVLIAANATPGVKQITLKGTACSGVCNYFPANITVNAPGVPPNISYSPQTGLNVTLGGGTGTVGSTASANITATPSGGSGTGASATTTIDNCAYSGGGAGAFGAPPGRRSFVGATTTPQSLPLTCTRANTPQNAQLTCSEARGTAGPVTRTWPVVCPAGGATAIPPALAFSPAAGSTVTFSGGGGTTGSTATGTIVVTPSGGSGSGAAATTTLGCGLSGTNASAFILPAPLSFVGPTNTPQSLILGCSRAATTLNATLQCTRSDGGAGGPTFSWSLVCPAGGQPQRSSVAVSLNPSRIRVSGPVDVQWSPVNAGNCAISSDRGDTTFTPNGVNRVIANVIAGDVARNETFTVACNGAEGNLANTSVLSVGVPNAPAAPAPVALSRGIGGQPANGASRNLELSNGGRFAVFESASNNLVPGDTNGTLDVFIRNAATGAITRASLGTGGAQLGESSGDAKVTADGSVVLYTTGTALPPAAKAAGAKNFTNSQMCINQLATNSAQCISKGPTGTPGNGASNNGSISSDGAVILYESTSSNLATNDTNGAVSDVFKYTSATNTTELLSLNAVGQSAPQPSTTPSVSCNGLNTVFESRAALIQGAVPGTRNIYAIVAGSPAKRLVTANANADSGNPRITNDGRFVFFDSDATNLVSGDTNGVRDVFRADLSDGSISRVSVSPNGTQGNGASGAPSIPCDGAYMTFESSATNLVAGDINSQPDTFMVNMGTGAITIASGTGSANGPSGNGAISPDGTVLGFDSTADNIGANGQPTVFAGENPFASQNYTGAWFDPAQAGHGLFLDTLSDGRLVAWWFTFDPSGAQAWFGGVGQLQGNNAVISVVRTEGARFLPNFVASEAVNDPIGTLTFNFTACDRGRVDFQFGAPFGSGFMDLTRLSAPLGVACGGSASVVEPTVGPIAGVTGAWYDPTQPGHGLFVENLGQGRLLMWWFTFGPAGGQSWFGGIADITDGNTAQMSFIRTAGGRWIPNFDPANVTNPVLGTATIRFPNCGEGTIDYVLQQGYGSGRMNLRPLLQPVGASCED